MAASSPCRLPKWAISRSSTAGGSRGIPASSRWPRGLTGASSASDWVGRPSVRGDRRQIQQVDLVEIVQRHRDLVDPLRVLLARQVVADQQLGQTLCAAEHLVELQAEQPAVGAEFDHVAGQLVGDPADHQQPLQHRHRVPQRREVLDLQRGQRPGHLVQPELVALQVASA